MFHRRKSSFPGPDVNDNSKFIFHQTEFIVDKRLADLREYTVIKSCWYKNYWKCTEVVPDLILLLSPSQINEYIYANISAWFLKNAFSIKKVIDILLLFLYSFLTLIRIKYVSSVTFFAHSSVLIRFDEFNDTIVIYKFIEHNSNNAGYWRRQMLSNYNCVSSVFICNIHILRLYSCITNILCAKTITVCV